MGLRRVLIADDEESIRHVLSVLLGERGYEVRAVASGDEALREIVEDPANWVEFRIEKGQLQYLNNRQFAHSRTAFKDAGTSEQGQGRHMLRLWNRDEGSWHLEGRPVA
jgi:hypothetical protein